MATEETTELSGQSNTPRDIRREIRAVDLFGAVKLAIEAEPLAGPIKTVSIIDWLLEDYEAEFGSNAVCAFVEAIRVTT